MTDLTDEACKMFLIGSVSSGWLLLDGRPWLHQGALPHWETVGASGCPTGWWEGGCRSGWSNRGAQRGGCLHPEVCPELDRHPYSNGWDIFLFSISAFIYIWGLTMMILYLFLYKKSCCIPFPKCFSVLLWLLMSLLRVNLCLISIRTDSEYERSHAE